ncbi:hypothetical protein ACFVDH_22015 [Streptomyces sp. NPDC057674]|uniref:hypothetical protein n=1 Tax=Streptomyces sp. NPDC057674 TaxID=3346203 RepID=UPI0036AB8D20
MSLCLICHRTPDPARTACQPCEATLRALLLEVDAQRPLLAASLYLGAAPAGGRVTGGGRAHSPLPVRGHVLTLLAAGTLDAVTGPRADQSGDVPLDTLLAGWAAAVANDLVGPGAVPFRRRGMTWATWLAAYMPHVVTASWVGAFHTELDDLVRRIRAVTTTEPRRNAMQAPCPSCMAFALGRTDWQTYIDCEACGTLLTPAEYDAHRATVMPPLARIGVLIAAHTHLTREAS